MSIFSFKKIFCAAALGTFICSQVFAGESVAAGNGARPGYPSTGLRTTLSLSNGSLGMVNGWCAQSNQGRNTASHRGERPYSIHPPQKQWRTILWLRMYKMSLRVPLSLDKANAKETEGRFEGALKDAVSEYELSEQGKDRRLENLFTEEKELVVRVNELNAKKALIDPLIKLARKNQYYNTNRGRDLYIEYTDSYRKLKDEIKSVQDRIKQIHQQMDGKSNIGLVHQNAVILQTTL